MKVQLKRLMVAAIVALPIFVFVSMARGGNPVQFLINTVCTPTSANSSCGKVQVSATITTPGTLRDFDDGWRKANLTLVNITATDTYQSYQTTGTICFSNCPTHTSNLVITFGNICVTAVGLSTGCKQYDLNPIPVVVRQVVNCASVSRTLTVNGHFYYSGCSNSGYIEFTLPAVASVRGEVTYHIALCGARNGVPTGPNPCGSPSPTK